MRDDFGAGTLKPRVEIVDCGIALGITQGPSQADLKREPSCGLLQFLPMEGAWGTTLPHGSRKHGPALLLYRLSSPGRDGTISKELHHPSSRLSPI